MTNEPTKTQHQFSPIISEERLQAAIEYLTEKSLALVSTVLDQNLSIDTLCFFAHTPEEYDFLEKAVRSRGTESKFSHGPTFYVDSDFTVSGQHIKIFGVRKPDPERPWVGYGDYPVRDYGLIRKLAADSPYAREIVSGRGQSLVELRHPDFDVLGFAVDEKNINKGVQ